MSVADVDSSVRFYQSVSTLTRHGEAPISAGVPGMGEAPVVVLAGPNAYLELTQVAPQAASEPMPVEGPGFTHVCFQSPAPDKLYRTCIDAGATPVSTGDAPIDLGGYGVLYGYARDADGLMFEVEEIDEPHFEGPFWIAHVSLVTPDIDRLVGFYEQLLGMPPYRRLNKVTGPRMDEITGLQNARARAAWFNTGNMVLELWEYLSPETGRPEAPPRVDQPGYNRFVFEVGDLTSELARLEAAGTQVLSGDADAVPSDEVYARDPDGNLFGLLELDADANLSLKRLKQNHWLP